MNKANPSTVIALNEEIESLRQQLETSQKREVLLRDALDQLLDDMGDDGHCVCEAAKQQAIEATASTEPKS